MAAADRTFTTDVPARLDRLPWSRFHWLVVAALGVTWILDGLEVTLVGSLSPAIARPDGLDLTASEVGLTGSAYILGAVLGSLVFGRLTDRFGRRRLFTVTIGVYLAATIATGFSWDFWSFAVFRFLTGAGIGGEYGAVNSAIQELIPARRRGYTDLAINGSFWAGAALGAMGSIVVLDPSVIDPALGWRLAFVIGGLLALVILWIRRYIPESPRAGSSPMAARRRLRPSWRRSRRTSPGSRRRRCRPSRPPRACASCGGSARPGPRSPRCSSGAIAAGPCSA